MGNELNPLSLFSESNDDGQYMCGVYTGPPEEYRRRRREKKEEKSASTEVSGSQSKDQPHSPKRRQGRGPHHEHVNSNVNKTLR